MTIQDYIAKHSLTLCQEYPDFKPDYSVPGSGASTSPIASIFIQADRGEFAHTDKFQIFGNPDRTHFVSINKTASLFRIIRADLIVLCSIWQPAASDYAIHTPMIGL